MRCKMIVKSEMEKLGFHCTLIELGRVETLEIASVKEINEIRSALSEFGLELIDDKKNILVEKIKTAIIEMVHYSDSPVKINFSSYLNEKLGLDYTYLANTFSEHENITIEHFVILHKIQRVKQLIQHNELSLTEIAWKLNYSSVAHLSTQFKKVTGVTPSYFKHIEHNSHIALENV